MLLLSHNLSSSLHQLLNQKQHNKYACQGNIFSLSPLIIPEDVKLLIFQLLGSFPEIGYKEK